MPEAESGSESPPETDKTVGIGLPVYNNSRHLSSALDSILNQTYTNLIVYLVDDRSTDNTRQICEHYAEQDSRIRFVENEQNLGEIGNYQKVLDMADTEYFMFARGHEILPENLLQDCVDILEEDKEVVLAFAKTVWIDEDNKPIKDKSLSYFDTRGCDVFSRCTLVFWGKYEYFYGVTRTRTMQSIKALEPIIATDLIMLFEMALRGSFAHINSGERQRRYYYDNETYDERIKRYQKILYQDIGFMDKYFPFAKLPFILFGCVFRSSHKIISKLLLFMVIIFNAPIRYITARGKSL